MQGLILVTIAEIEFETITILLSSESELYVVEMFRFVILTCFLCS
jgi:hypothetical protein